MTEFLILYHAPKELEDKHKDMSKEDMGKMMQAWMKWAENCGENLLDMGSPIGNAKRLDSSNSTSSNSEAGGYSIMQADSITQIEELLKNNPHLEWGEGCYIEIHEKMPLPKC